MHFAHIAVLTIYLLSIIYFTAMLPQHHIYRNELNCECYNITLAGRNIAPWWRSKKDRNMSERFEVFLCGIYVNAIVGL